MATDIDIAQSDLVELLTVLGMGDHARPQSPHEVFQEALGVLEIKLGSREGRIERLAASVSALVEMLRARPDIHALCGFEERDILAEACAALNVEEYLNADQQNPRAALRRIICLCGGWEKTHGPDEPMPYELAEVLKIARAAAPVPAPDRVPDPSARPAPLAREG